MAASLFHSTNLEVGEILEMEVDSLSGSFPQKVFPGHEFLVAIKRESLTLFVWKNAVLWLDHLFGLENRHKKTVFFGMCRSP